MPDSKGRKAPPIERIPLGTVLPGGSQFWDGNLNDVYRAPVRLESGTTSAFVKKLGEREVAVELVCAVVGRAMDLPIPKPMLVRADHAALPDLVGEGDTIVTFASESSDHPSLQRTLLHADRGSVYRRSRAVPHICGFDEWIANPDRNLGNILYDGGDSFWFLDHEHALPDGHAPSQPSEANLLFADLCRYMTSSEIIDVCDELKRTFFPKLRLLPLDDAMSKARVAEVASADIAGWITQFLECRIPSLVPLIEKRAALEQKELLS